jgi:hypothetical protein
MFADYRVPQVLYHFGILEYEEQLKRHLFDHKIIKKHSEMEIAIRGLSIYACEVREIERKMNGYSFPENR